MLKDLKKAPLSTKYIKEGIIPTMLSRTNNKRRVSRPFRNSWKKLLYISSLSA
jgi:hypothetical protein